MKEALLDILFPPICLHCKKNLPSEEKAAGICGLCMTQINIHTTLFCAQCRARLPENKKICHRDTKYMLAAAVNYDGPVKDLVHQLKYRRWTSLMNLIGPMINKYIENLGLRFENYIIIPIPLHPERLQKRGFNQAEIIGLLISQTLRLPMRTDILQRIRRTKSQAELKDYNERLANISEAFRAAETDYIKDKNILLVDDVYTSGATMNDAVRALRAAGAKKIIAFIFAKTK